MHLECGIGPGLDFFVGEHQMVGSYLSRYRDPSQPGVGDQLDHDETERGYVSLINSIWGDMTDD